MPLIPDYLDSPPVGPIYGPTTTSSSLVIDFQVITKAEIVELKQLIKDFRAAMEAAKLQDRVTELEARVSQLDRKVKAKDRKNTKAVKKR